MMIAIPDLISNSYFPAQAAVELGFFRKEGLDAEYRLIYPVAACYEAMRDGDADFVAGSAHSVLSAFPEWRGARLLCALSQGMYWFLVVRADLDIAPGDAEGVKGLRIGAAPWVDYGLWRMLKELGLDPDSDVSIGPIPGAFAKGDQISFGVTAAKALEDGKVDAFWANGMGAEVAVTRGVGSVVFDPRRGVGPGAAFNYTQPTLATTERRIADDPDGVAAAVRAIVNVQAAIRSDVGLAAEVGRKTFPEVEAGLIAQVVERDLPFYDAAISEAFVDGMNRFARDMGVLAGAPSYEDVVATRFSGLWHA